MKRAKVLFPLFFICIFQLSAQDTLSVMSYNLLNFPTVGIVDREDTLRKIVQYSQPDVLMVCELKTSGGADLILNESLNVYGTTKYQKATFTPNQSFPSNELQGMLFYNSEKLTLYSQDVIQTELRDINEYILYYNSPTLAQHNDTIFIDFYVAHLKSSNGSAQATQRWREIKNFKDYIDSKPTDRNRILGGDFNVYNSNEPSYTSLLDTGTYKMIDPINQPGNWSNNSAFAAIHTQSPRTTNFGSGATGGLDDRFDFLLISEQIDSGTDSVSYINNTYEAVGNDGNHFNQSILDGVNNSVPDSVLYAIYYMSDHLPVSMKLKIDVDLGTTSTVTPPVVLGGATDLIISEYAEGSSNNKYIELYNGTNATINLANYQIQYHNNGGSGSSIVFPLSGTLNNGATYVIANNSSNTTIKNNANLLTTSTVFSFNGNDVIELQKDNGSGTFVTIDAIGENTGIDPGTGWNVAGTLNATSEHTLIRKSTICSPNDDWTSSAGTNSTNSEWIVNPQDYFTDIGMHTQNCAVPTVNFVSTASNQTEPNTTTTILIPVEMQDIDAAVNLSVAVTGGTADLPDYNLNTTALSFTINGIQNISIDINADADLINETVEITIMETSSTGITIINGTHTITIIDNSCDISNVVATALPCNGNDAQFTVSWTETNTSANIEVDINGNGYQSISSGGTYTITGPTTAVTNAVVTVRDANENVCQGTGTVDIPACPNTPAVLITQVIDPSDDLDKRMVEICNRSTTSVDITGWKLNVDFNGNTAPNSASVNVSGNVILNSGECYVFGNNNFPTADLAACAGYSLSGNINSNGNEAFWLSDGSQFIDFFDGFSYNFTDSKATRKNNITTPNATFDANEWTLTAATAADVNPCNNTVLPVELLSFDAKQNQKVVEINWATAAEINNAYFEIQRSIDGSNFETIGQVAGAGTTYEVQHYTFIDENPVNGTNYYRLRQVDFDNNFEYYETKFIIINNNPKINAVQIIPNQVSNQFDIVFGTTTKDVIQVDIFNVNGQLLKSVNIGANSNRQTVDVARFQSGLYMIRMNINNTIVTKRFIKL